MKTEKLDIAQFEGHKDGPWTLDESTCEISSVSTGQRIGYIANTGYFNANLIAAAPALLALAREQQQEIARLREALSRLEGSLTMHEGKDVMGRVKGTWSPTAREAARAALAKGEQT